jgi:hypothetical protein
MMIKYVTGFAINIEEQEIVRETEHMVIYNTVNGHERREKKRSEYKNYFDTWQDAKEFLERKYTNKKARAEINLAEANKELEKVKALTA